jgi:NADH-quinone oxidoreductase subunit M
MLWMFRRVIFGPLANAANERLADLNGREIGLLAPILFLIVLMGVYPQPFLRRMQPAVELTLKRIATMTAAPVATNHDTDREPQRDGQ